jgi:hypothetical protein
MSKLGKIALLGILDAILGVLFVATNWWIWDYLDGKNTANVWGPFQITIIPQFPGGGPVGVSTPIPNYPFIIFWVALAVNFIFVVLALKKES